MLLAIDASSGPTDLREQETFFSHGNDGEGQALALRWEEESPTRKASRPGGLSYPRKTYHPANLGNLGNPALNPALNPANPDRLGNAN